MLDTRLSLVRMLQLTLARFFPLLLLIGKKKVFPAGVEVEVAAAEGRKRRLIGELIGRLEIGGD